MKPTPRNWAYGCLWVLVIGGVFGCASPSFYSYLVYENPTAFVRLEFSPWADTDRPHTWNAHPTTLSRRQIQKALEGLRVREHRAAPFRWFRGIAEKESVFRQDEIDVLLPAILEGLELAVPQELLTFYVSHPVNATKREVTSGGLYVTEGQLHIIVSNFRAVYGIPPAGLIHDRRYPLLSLGPLSVDIFYEGDEGEVVDAKEEGLVDAIFGDERSGEIVLDLSRLSMMNM